MPVEHRGLLIHATHYAPGGWLEKDKEEPFDLPTALEFLPVMAECGMNLLVIDIEDGVTYRSHPEMSRHYSVPVEQMKTLADEARQHGIDIVPKLNFSKSGRNFHDMWMKPHWDHVRWLKNMDEYYQVAADVMAELVEQMQPGRFIHIGMDEDHYRSLQQYVDTIETLRQIVAKLGLRTIVWNDSCHDQPDMVAQSHADKCRAAEEHLSKDIVHVLWDYHRTHPEKVKRIADRGFEVWAAPGWYKPEDVADWRKAVETQGGNGLLMTRWIKCSRTNRDKMMTLLKTLGLGYHA